MKCLYKVPFSGFFMAYAESAEEAKKMSPDDGEVIYSEQSTGEIEACPDGRRPSRLTTIIACLLTRQTMNLTRAFPRIGRMSCEH